MRNPGGYGIVICPVDSPVWFDGGLRREFMRAGKYETDTVKCGHCGGHASVKPYSDPADMGALCKKCMHVVCRRCVNLGRKFGITCDPIEAKFERSEKRDRQQRYVSY